MPHRQKRLLSQRQFECLQGVADLLDSVQIAERLGISEHTVNGHLSAAIAALEAASRRDAVRKYLVLQAEHPEKVTGQFLRVSPPSFSPAPGPANSVREPEAPAWEMPPSPEASRGEDHHALGHRLKTFGMVIGIATAIVIIILAVEPLSDSAMRIANRIQPYQPR